jgi:NAD(P)H-dependent flavin oxidoreductase YrpB (nitropropane dioxygenase family)
MNYPKIIQGGMGVAVSTWTLARAVSLRGQLGVVSGTAIDVVFARRLQLGDVGGHMRRALESFPVREVAERVWNRYFVPGGKDERTQFKSKPMHSLRHNQALEELTVVANFAEVWLAKQGHRGLVGVNLLEKIQLPTLPSLFGAILAGVDFVLMGAGIPRQIPGVLDGLADLRTTELRIEVARADAGDSFAARFDPGPYAQGAEVRRPQFLAIVSSGVLAKNLATKASGRVDGFVVEGSTAGGHNAPPRGKMELDATGQPVYGVRDVPDLQDFRDLGAPFWLAGSYGDPAQLRAALAEGAKGIQVGTAFAFCEESGLDPELRARVLALSVRGGARVYTDPLASPTGFPFKVVQAPGTMAEARAYEARTRVCDLGYLRTPYKAPDGSIGYRCAAEPVEDYVAKGGTVADTVGRKCVCNGLLAAIALGQTRKTGETETALLTAGDDVAHLAKYLPPGRACYTASDVIDFLLGHRA